MKNLMLLVLILLSIKSFAEETATIVTPSTTIVCNKSEIFYTANFSGLLSQTSYTIVWDYSNGTPLSTEHIGSPYTSSIIKMKWDATANASGNIGTLQVKLKVGNTVVAESDILEITIKSIKHLQPEISPNFGGIWNLSPCNAGSQSLDATDLIVPSTEGVNPEDVYIFQWVIPEGWSINGQTSNGQDPIAAGQNVNVFYPANHEEGSIKVRGYHAVSGCSDGAQVSKWSNVITVNRKPTFTLTPNPNTTWLFCGNTNPVTYTLTCDMTLTCVAYYWNNSTTSTTNNTFTYTPDGETDFTVFVRAVYGDSEKSESHTIEYKIVDPANLPFIDGSPSICNGEDEEYSIINVPANYNVNWSCTGAVQLKSGQGTTTAEFEKTGTGDAKIEAKLITNCGNWPTKKNIEKNVWAGLPGNGLYPDNIIGPDCIEIGESNVFFDGIPMPLIIEGTEWYNWTLSPQDANIHIYPYSGQASARIEVDNGASTGTYTLFVNAENQCGTNGSGWASFDVATSGNCYEGYYMTMSPNPASDFVELSFTTVEETPDKTGKLFIKKNKKNKTMDSFGEYEIQIWSEIQMKVKIKSDKKYLNISTKNLSVGKYYLHLIKDKNIYKQQLIIE